MAISDADGIIYYRFIYDTYGELSDITTDDGVSLKSSEQLTEYRLAELAHATGIDYLYNGQFGVETDQNGLYYMRARYYNQDIKRFINRDIVSGDITNSQSLNRYCYVQGDPVSLTDPFGLCPDPNSNFKDFCKFLNNADWNALGHAALDVAGIFWEGADVINALWYAMEGNTEMAIASAIFAIPGLGIGVGNLMMKSEKLASAGKAVKAISKMTQSGMGIASGISIAKVGFTNMLNSIEAGEFSFKDFATFVGGVAIATISGKGLVSSGKGLMDVLDGAGKTSKAGKGYLTDSDVNSMPMVNNDSASSIRTEKVVAGSGEISYESIMRALRQSGTKEGYATAALLKRGKLKLKIEESHPNGYGGIYRFGTDYITIYRAQFNSPLSAAGYTAHETKHYLQKLTSSNYSKMHEYEAYVWQRNVDKSFGLRTDDEIWKLINTHEAYKNLK